MTSRTKGGTNSTKASFVKTPRLQQRRELVQKNDEKVDDNDKDKDPNGLPTPRPPGKTKADIFQFADYAGIDDWACEAEPTLRDQPLADLVEYLLRPTLNDELGRVRVIYRWITAQDLSKISGKRTAGGELVTPMDYLLGIKANKINCNTLLQNMCKLANLQVVPVAGFVKNAGYEIGEKFDGNANKSWWTAVLINGSWQLIDVQRSSQNSSSEVRAAGAINGHQDQPPGNRPAREEKETRTSSTTNDEAFFLPSPDEFVYTHCAEDPKWQLVAKPLSVDEFSQLALLRPAFFARQLRLISHKKCIEHAPEGAIKVELGLPPKAGYRFTYKLWMSTRGRYYPFFKDQELKRFVFVENVKGKLTCDIQFPVEGQFKLELFCLDASAEYPSDDLVCAYAIDAQKAKKNARFYPENGRQEWGPGCDLLKAGLRAVSHKAGVVDVNSGETEVSFQTVKDVEVLVQMTGNKKSSEELKRYVVQRMENRQLFLNVAVPGPGDYALHLYVKNRNDVEGEPEAEAEVEDFVEVCTYLLSATTAPSGRSPFPDVPNGRLGPLEGFEQLGLKTLSHPSASFEAPSSGQVDITVSNPLHADLLASLSLSGEKSDKNVDEFAFVQKSVNATSISARLPQTGRYTLNLFGKPKGEADRPHPLVFTYVIVHQPATAFPKSYSKWDASCAMLSPDIGAAVVAGTKVQFCVRVRKALEVAVVDARETWTHFGRDNRGNWKAEVDVPERPGELHLVASFSKDTSSSNYETLLVFQSQVYTLMTNVKPQRAKQRRPEATTEPKSTDRTDRKPARDSRDRAGNVEQVQDGQVPVRERQPDPLTRLYQKNDVATSNKFNKMA